MTADLPQSSVDKLRADIKRQVESFAADAVAASKTARGFAYGNQIDAILAIVTAEIGAALEKLEPFAKSDSPNSNDAIRFCVTELRNHFGIGDIHE